MDPDVVQFAQRLLEGGFAGMSEREQRVLLRLAKRTHVAKNVDVVIAEQQTFGERLADQVAQFGGSWRFIILFCLFLAVWMALNSIVLVYVGGGFDPYPYIFLNLMLSMVAAIQAPVILMSQNRQAARDRLAATLDYDVNLKAEVEIMALHDKLDHIRLDRLDEAIRVQTRRIEELAELVRAGRPSGSDIALGGTK